MSEFRYELKKLMYHQRGLLFIAIFLLVSLLVLVITDSPCNSAMEQYRPEYEWYLERISGRCTDQVSTYLESEAEAITDASRRREELLEKYYDGGMGEDDFNRQRQKLDATLEHERGFDVIYQQYLYICENAENRYFVQTNGWTGLLNEKPLDFVMLLTILLLVTPAFCAEYSCQMDTLILTSPKGQKSARYKLLILSVCVILLSVVYALMQYAFFAAKYGLPNGNYPLQSVVAYGGSEKTISLFGAFIMISLLRLFGCLYFSLVIFLLSVTIKKYSLTLLLSAASMLIPYIALPKTTIYRLPLPLPFFLGTGYLAGSAYAENAMTGERVTVFQEVGSKQLTLVFAISVLLCAASVCWVIYRNSNQWQTAHSRKRSVAFLPIVLAVLALTGCSAREEQALSYNSAYPNVCRDYRVELDYVAQKFSIQNNMTENTTDLVQSPLFGTFGDGETILACFCNQPYIYYALSKTEGYVDRVGRFNSTFTTVSIVQLNTETFEEKVVFEQIADATRSVLGIEYETGNQWEFLPYISGFFLNKSTLFFLTDHGIVKVDRQTRSIGNLPIHSVGNIAFDGRNIYYLDQWSKLTKYDTFTDSTTAFQVIATDFCLDRQHIYYVDRMDERHVFSCDLNGENSKLLYDAAALRVYGDGSDIYTVSESDGKAVCLTNGAKLD